MTIKVACLVTLFDLKLQVFKNSPKLTFFGIFDELFATRNVNDACFARNVLCDFFCNFHTSWLGTWILTLRISHVIDFFSWHTWLFSRRKWIKKSYIFFPFGVKVSSPVLRVLSSTIYFCVQLIFALTSTSTTPLEVISWRKKVFIWIHLLLRQPFSRLLVTQNRLLKKATVSLLGND